MVVTLLGDGHTICTIFMPNYKDFMSLRAFISLGLPSMLYLLRNSSIESQKLIDAFVTYIVVAMASMSFGPGFCLFQYACYRIRVSCYMQIGAYIVYLMAHEFRRWL